MSRCTRARRHRREQENDHIAVAFGHGDGPDQRVEALRQRAAAGELAGAAEGRGLLEELLER